MTLRQMKFFITVCEKKSISKAARYHYISHQALSKIIKEMEIELDVSLLVRSNTGVEMTSYGAYVYDTCKHIYSLAKDMPIELRQMKEAINETIKVGVAFGVLSAITPDLFIKFQTDYPNISLQMFDYQDFICESKLEEKELDVICTLGPLDKNKFKTSVIKSELIYLCIHHSDPLYSVEDITMESLKESTFVIYSDKFRTHHNFLAACRRAGFEPHIILTSNEFNLLEEMAMEGKGIFLMPAHTLRENPSGYRYVKFPDPECSWDVNMAVLHDTEPSDGIYSFTAYLYHHTQKYREEKD